MNFALSDQQRQLGESLERLLAKVYDFNSRAAIVGSAAGYSAQVWQQFAELGLTALPLPEDYEGFGGTTVDLLPVMTALGRALVVEPYLSSVVLGATALQLAGSFPQCQAVLPGVARGELLLAFAHGESAARHPMWVATTARQVGGQWVLAGNKANVLHGESADHIVVSARVAGQPGDAEGVALFLLQGDAPGLVRRGFRLLDDMPAAELILDDVPAERLGGKPGSADAGQVVRQVMNIATAAACAQALGAMQGAYDMTLAYLGLRQQFGKPLGQNQALRHRAAEMLVHLETCRSMALLAAVAAAAPSSPRNDLDIRRAKAIIGRYGRLVCLEAVQMHGGIGVTEEYAVGHFLRRVTVLDHLFGDEHQHVAALAAALENG